MPRQDAERYDDAVWNGGWGSHLKYFGVSNFFSAKGFLRLDIKNRGDTTFAPYCIYTRASKSFAPPILNI